MSGLFERLLKKRGVKADFLSPKYEDCVDPFVLNGMDEAVKRIKQAVEKQEKILIYGDYDVDGVTASTIMHDALEMAGVKEIEIMLPDRFVDGYGMNEKVVKQAKERGCSLIITVDCGSRNNDIIDKINAAQIDVIVTDHHECGETLPKAVAVINPKSQADGELHDLAGAGVAFKVAQALVKEGLIQAGREKWLLDLVAIGTICDSMVLLGENRRLCYYGMIVLEKTHRVGLQELMKVAGIKKITSDAIGFQLGPRLNAAGRMKSAYKSLNLLMEKDRAEAAKLAYELNELNTNRKIEQGKAVREIADQGLNNDPVIVEKGDWHEGIIGIIAGRLVEQYRRPAFVFTEIDGALKGSGRSFGDFNLAEALKECQNTIVSGGGHSGACGVKVLMVNYDAFKKEVNDYYRSLNLKDQERYLDQIEDLAVNELADFSLEFTDELKKLEPYGLGNPEPVFLLRNVFVQDVRKMGVDGKHLGLIVRDNSGSSIKLVAFYASDEWLSVEVGARIDVWITVERNEWNNLSSVEGRIVKLNLAS